MPELPEVETTVSLLKKEVLKRTFVSVWAEKEAPEGLLGRRIEDIYRCGKCIIFLLDGDLALFVHLRMTGHFLLGEWKMKEGEWKSEEEIMQDKRNGYLRFILSLDDGRQLALSDARKFAKLYAAPLAEIESYLQRIGPDILSLNKKEFTEMLSKKKGEIKRVLMDQRFVSGVGNIYAAEALFLSGVHPQKKADSLSIKKAEDVYESLHKVLRDSIKLQGDSTSDFRLLSGERGGYQNKHLVYDRKGEKCFSCGKEIKRVSLGGRGSYYCPYCQKI